MNSSTKISLSMAALIAGVALFIMAIAAPFAEFFVFQKLNVAGNSVETAKNIIANKALFTTGVFCYLVTAICDIIVAWALYILLKPVNEQLSLLTAWFRLVYTVIALAAILNLVTLLRLLNNPDLLILFKSDQLYAQIMLCFNSFRGGWSFSILFFGIHLVLLGYLAFRSGYIPKILGVLLIIAGLGWLTGNLRPFLYPNFDVNYTIIDITGSFELIFMFWLVIRGSKIKVPIKE